MLDWLAIDWGSLLAFEISPIEILLRGSVMYLSLFTLLRTVLKRETGSTDISDLLVVVLLADAAQSGMAGAYRSILPDGLHGVERCDQRDLAQAGRRCAPPQAKAAALATRRRAPTFRRAREAGWTRSTLRS